MPLQNCISSDKTGVICFIIYITGDASGFPESLISKTGRYGSSKHIRTLIPTENRTPH